MKALKLIVSAMAIFGMASGNAMAAGDDCLFDSDCPEGQRCLDEECIGVVKPHNQTLIDKSVIAEDDADKFGKRLFSYTSKPYSRDQLEHMLQNGYQDSANFKFK